MTAIFKYTDINKKYISHLLTSTGVKKNNILNLTVYVHYNNILHDY